MSEPAMPTPLGFSGALTRAFLTSEITPLLALVGFLLGLFAISVTPREEEPQIDVTFANIFIPFPGATATEVEHLVSAPAEQVLSEIKGVKHIYATAQPGLAVLTVEYQVGVSQNDALVQLYNKVFSNQDWLPQGLGVGQPLIKPKGIDDVPIVTGTLWSEDPNYSAYDLLQVAHALETELKRVPGTRDVYTIGGPDRVVHVLLDPIKLSGFGLDVADLKRALQSANLAQEAGALVRDNQEITVQAGAFLSNAEEIADLIVGMQGSRPIYLRDVADVRHGSDQPERYTRFGTGPAAAEKGITAQGQFPAVTLAVAKQPGANAVQVASQVISRFAALRGLFVPDNVQAVVTRDYGATADDKAKKLISKLTFATASVVLLVLLALGWREAIIVGLAVVITLAITLFASWAWGFTLNRVSLFALIFSIGILVDDAIVVVENIHRHMQLYPDRTLAGLIPNAVDEVGGPTILATFTVIAALLPMAFVSGLMGPYMSPIPINASLGMIISLAVAFTVTPWLSNKLLRHHAHAHGGAHSAPENPAAAEAEASNGLYRFFAAILTPFLRSGLARAALYFGLLALIVLAVSLASMQLVVLKMLPFDNKSEFQIVLDMPEGTSLEQTGRVLDEIAQIVAKTPEVTDYQIYAGTAAPINFNGLIRQYYLREGAHFGDIQVNLTDKHHRVRKSHTIALATREALRPLMQQYQANIKVVEVPPGPPVLSPLVAEIYGLDYQGQIQAAKAVRTVFEHTPDIIDVDDSVESPAPRLILQVDRTKAARLGLSQAQVAETVSAVLRGEDVGYVHGASQKYPVPIRLEFTVADKASIDRVLNLKLKSAHGTLIPLAEVSSVHNTTRENAIYHKDLLPVVYVLGDMAGKLDSPLYGMFNIFDQLLATPLAGGVTLNQFFTTPPDNPYRYSLKWDGEWQVTYETFRDMGIAYAVGMVMIYLLVVAQFRSYLVPLIIMAPIPMTIIGVMPGHALLGAQFTATSMIGMIALAGIIVRNSILLVDFINEQVRSGIPFDEAVIRSGSVRAKPIVLTGLAAMLGAFFILDDPIFSGLAVALIFGISVSTALTLVVIPVMYYAAMHKRLQQQPDITNT